MTTPGGEVVGRQYVEIWPTLRRWASELRSGMSQANAETKRQLQPIERQVEQHHRNIMASTVGLVARAGRTIATAGGAAATAAAAIGVKTAASLETAQTAFTQLLGGVKQSQKFMGELSRFAAATPFEMPGLIDASRQLLGAGAAAKSVIPTLTAWGNAAGSLGIQQEDFNGIILAVTQSMNKGKVQAEELMQITERGIPIYPLLAKALHMSVPELQKLASEGKLNAKEVFPALEKQLNKEYGGGLIKQSRTLLGIWSTFKDTFTQGMAGAIQPALPIIKNVLDQATVDMQDFFTGIQGGTDKTRTNFTVAGYGIRAFFQAIKDGDVTSDGFVGRMEQAGAGLRELIQGFKTGGSEATGFIGVMGRIGAATRDAFDYIKNTAIPQIKEWVQNFRDSRGEMAGTRQSVTEIGDSFQKIVPSITKFNDEMPSLNDALKVTSTVMGFVADHTDLLNKLLPVLVGLIVAHKLAQLAANIAQAASLPLKAAEIVVNRQLIRSNRELIESRKGVTAASKADVVASSTGILARSMERLKTAITGVPAQGKATAAAIDQVGGGATRAAAPAGRMASATGRIGSALKGIGGATVGALGGVIGGLGPLGLGLSAAAAFAGIFAARKREAKQKVEEFTEAIKQDTGALGTNVAALAAQRLEQSGALKAAGDLGLSMQTVTQAALGNADAQRIVAQTIKNKTTISEADARALNYNAVELANNRNAASKLDGALGDLTGQIRSAKESADRQTAAVGGTTGALGKNATAADVAAAAVGGLNAKLAAHIQAATDATRSDYDFRDSLSAMTASVQANGRSLDVNTVAGRNNRRAILDAVDAAKRHSDAVYDQTHDQGKSTKAFWDSIPAIKEQARRLGLNKKEVDDLIRSIAGLKPKTVPVSVVVTATGKVTAPNGVVIVPGRRAGGWIGGFSPHGEADDQMIAASSKEYMIRRASATKLEREAPGLLDYLNNYHRLGQRVGPRIDVGGDAGTTRIAVGRRLRFAQGGSIPEIQSFIRSTDRLPYVWGQAGPYSYDCSGLTGAVYGKLTGRGGGQGQRYFTTSTVGAAQGFRPGRGTYTIGVTSGMGHMVGNLAGLKFEARSTDTGIFTGAAAQSVNNFPRVMYLPSAGGVFGGDSTVTLNATQQQRLMQQVMPLIVRQVIRDLGIKRDVGGAFGPGQIAVNEAGGRERVLNASQNTQWERGMVTPEALRDALEGMTIMMKDPFGKVVAGQLASYGQRGPR